MPHMVLLGQVGKQVHWIRHRGGNWWLEQILFLQSE